MDWKEYRTNLVWGVAVTFTFAQLMLLPVAFYYPEQRETAGFLIWFAPWFVALIFTLIFIFSWLGERKGKKNSKECSTKSEDVKQSKCRISYPDDFHKMSPEQITAFFEGLSKFNNREV